MLGLTLCLITYFGFGLRKLAKTARHIQFDINDILICDTDFRKDPWVVQKLIIFQMLCAASIYTVIFWPSIWHNERTH